MANVHKFRAQEKISCNLKGQDRDDVFEMENQLQQLITQAEDDEYDYDPYQHDVLGSFGKSHAQQIMQEVSEIHKKSSEQPENADAEDEDKMQEESG